jgi:hypothetical protein
MAGSWPWLGSQASAAHGTENLHCNWSWTLVQGESAVLVLAHGIGIAGSMQSLPVLGNGVTCIYAWLRAKAEINCRQEA